MLNTISGKKKWLVGLILLALLALVLFSLILSNSAANTPSVDFNNGWFSLKYPEGYKADGSYVNMTFRSTSPEQGAAEAASDYFTVSRYISAENAGSQKELLDKLTEISNGGDDTRKNSMVKIKDTDAILSTVQTSDQLTETYYMFTGAYVWSISFYTQDGSPLRKNTAMILETFNTNEDNYKI